MNAILGDGSSDKSAGGSTHSEREIFAEVSNECFSGGARACTRSVASLTSKRSTRHPLSSADSGKSGASGDDRSGERSRDRSSDRSRERSRGSCSRGPRQVPGRQDPMFADVGHDTDLPTARWRLRFPSRSRGVTDPSSRATSGTPLVSPGFRENPHRNPGAWCQGSDPSAAFVGR